MTIQMLIMLMTMCVVVMSWYANSSKRNKIYCSFTRINRTSVHKFVKMASRYVVFDGSRYDIIPQCIVFDWWDKGLVHMLFPQWVATLEFTYASRRPIDPATGSPAIISPEVRNLLNKEEWAKGFAKTSAPQAAKKETLLQRWLPWVTVGLVVLMGFYFYTNMQAMGGALADIANKVNAITQ